MSWNTMDSLSLARRMTVEGRRLAAQDIMYLQTAYSLNVWCSFACPTMTRDDEKLRVAFRHVVEVTPILQSRVVEVKDDKGDVDHYVFTLEPEENWPEIEIQHVSDDGLIKTANSYLKEQLELLRDGGTEAVMSTPVKICAVMDSQRVCFAVVTPHHFMDGVGLNTLITKMAIYARFPRLLWRTIDWLNPREVPTFVEMAMKSDLEKFAKVNHQDILDSDVRFSPGNFKFSNHDMTDPSASDQLAGFKGEVGSVPLVEMKKCRKELRQIGLSVTSAFGALAIKTLALLLEQFDLNPGDKPLLSTIGADGRNLGTWGDRRRDRGGFPVVGNYTFAFAAQIATTTAKSSLSSISKEIKTSFDRLRNDPDFRARKVAVHAPFSSEMWCGVSSIAENSTAARLRGMAGIRDIDFDADIDFGPMPRVWFYVLSLHGAPTPVVVDIMLPIEGLTPAAVQDTIVEAAKGSPLESVFKR